MKRNGFLSVSTVFAFFLVFLSLMLYIILNMSNNRFLLSKMKETIKSELIEEDADEEENENSLENYIKKLYTGTQGENNLYYHNGTIKDTDGNIIDAEDNSYRYAGSSETTNNFVCFGSDETTCPSDNLYRIIGVFDNKVKLIKWDYPTTDLLGTNGDYSGMCDTSSYCKNVTTGKGVNEKTKLGMYWWSYVALMTSYDINRYFNDWSYSALNKINLNVNFINNVGTKWSNMIEESTWIVGGNTSNNLEYYSTAKSAYISEIISYETNQVGLTYEAKVALMYVSDYYYGASPSYWNKMGYDKNDSTNDYRSAINDNWLYMGLNEFILTRDSASLRVFGISNDGAVSTIDMYNLVDRINEGNKSKAVSVRPVFYLKKSISYVGGSGTKTDPIIIK